MEQNNNIEKFFKKKFSDPVNEQDWNTPPDDTWDNILDGLEEKPKKKRRIIYIPWLFGGLALIITAYLFINNENQNARIETLENQINDFSQNSNDQIKNIDQQNPSDQELSSNNQNNNKQNIKNENIDQTGSNKTISRINKNLADGSKKVSSSNTQTSNQRTQQIAAKQSVDGTISIAGNNNNRNNTPSSPPVNSNSTNNIQATVGLLDTIEQDNLIKSNSTDFDRAGLANNSILDLDMLKGLMLAQMLIPIEDRTRIKLTNPVPERLIVHQKQVFQYGVFVRQNNWMDRNSGQFDNPLEGLLTQENTLNSVAVGIYGSMNLSKKWTANIGVLYNQRDHESSYFIQLPFSTNTETLDSEGELINAFQHSLPTSLGDVQTDVILSRSQSSSISNNEIVDIDLSFKNKTRSIIIPVSASYFPKGANNGLYFSGGLLNEIILSNQLNGIQSESHHDTVNDKSIVIQYNDDQQNSYGLGASFGLGYVFNLKNDFNLMLGANYDFALTSNYINNGYQHKIDNISIGLGFTKLITK